MRTTQNSVLFWRTKDIYSNWHPSVFVIDGVTYANAEQYMMAAKARLFDDAKVEAEIMAVKGEDPKRMKALGRQVRGYVDDTWVAHREQVMFDACFAKFEQNAALKEQLLATGERTIIEASPVDSIWGIGLAEEDPAAEDPKQWKGLNLLGVALMRVREALQPRS